jgi:AraC-like DNA-binding protein
MLLLQSTDQAVNRIALDVGYESPSRFANRFRERFGFAPTAIRGHARGGVVEREVRRGGVREHDIDRLHHLPEVRS